MKRNRPLVYIVWILIVIASIVIPAIMSHIPNPISYAMGLIFGGLGILAYYQWWED